jgi:hypothetical protein
MDGEETSSSNNLDEAEQTTTNDNSWRTRTRTRTHTDGTSIDTASFDQSTFKEHTLTLSKISCPTLCRQDRRTSATT